jgi:hypothetical protein
MNEISQLKMDIAASLYIIPATIDELLTRDFLINKSRYGIELMLQQMEKDSWIFFKKEKYYTYKKFALSPRMSGYDLHGLHDKPKRLTAEQAIKKYNR